MSWSSKGSSYESPAELLADVRRRLRRIEGLDVEARLRQSVPVLGDKTLLEAIETAEPFWRIERFVAKLEELEGHRNLLWFGRTLRATAPDGSAADGFLYLFNPKVHDGGAEPITVGEWVVVVSTEAGGLLESGAGDADADASSRLLWRLESPSALPPGTDVIVPDQAAIKIRLVAAGGSTLRVHDGALGESRGELGVSGLSDKLAVRVTQALEIDQERLDGDNPDGWILTATLAD